MRGFLFRSTPFRLVLMFAAAAALAGCGGGSGSSQIPAGVSNSAQQNAPGTAGAVLSGTSWQLQAGGGQDAGALQALAMLPSAIIIDVGDSVTWAVAGEAHTITFNCCAGDPTLPQGGSTFNGSNFVSSGVLVPGQHYTLKFTKAGTYKYACVLHPPEMTGTIIVQPRGTAYPGSQGFYTGLGTSALKVFLSAADIAVRSDVLFGVGGTMVAAGISPFGPSAPPSQSTVLRFLSGDRVNATSVTIRVGTTLTWKNLSSNEPHTVTFPVAGQPLPPLPGDPFTPPIGGSTYDGSHITNSGVMNPGQSYSLTFTKAGTFGYECLFHDAFGMLGTVIVK